MLQWISRSTCSFFIHVPPIHAQFVAEIPRRRVLKKGQPLGRMAAYRDFSIVRVDASSTGSNREWRALGTKTMFAESVEHKRLQQQQEQQKAMQHSISQSSMPDATFITTYAAVSGFGGGAYSHDVVADDVMQKVVKEMGLINSAELLLLKDKAALPPRLVHTADTVLFLHDHD